jgi:hypothetical protein
MSNHGISGRHFAFIVNIKRLPDPFLVELSRRTKTAKRNVEFYEPNVLYCPPEMEPILQALLDDNSLFKHHRHIVKEAMVSTLQHMEDSSHFDYRAVHETALEAIMDIEIAKRMYPKNVRTRLAHRRHNKVKAALKSLRT